MSLEDWDAVIDTNLSGVFHGCKFGLEVMNDGGAIVNIGSLSATAGFHGQSNYAAAKAGVHALTRVLSRECSRRSIRVNAVAPGVIDTPLMEAVSAEVRASMVPRHPPGEIRPADRGGVGCPVPGLAARKLCDRAYPGG